MSVYVRGEGLIVEIPRHANLEQPLLDGIVRYKEHVAVT